MARSLKYLLLLTLLTAGLQGCGDGAKTADENVQKPSPEPPSTSKTPPRGKGQDASKPDDTNAAYFGELPYERLDAPLKTPGLDGKSVVLLVIDALNVKHLSGYGYTRKTSPNIDDLASSGLVLTNYVSNSSWTRPSYTTIITGLPKSAHKVELEGGWRLEPEIKTLAERFKSAGYRTASFTSNPLVRKSWGFDQGFQVYEDPATLDRKAFFPDRLLVEMAEKWLDANRERPFFLVVFLTAPHTPYRPPTEPRTFLKEVASGKIIEHPFKEYLKPLKEADHERIVAAYDDEIAYMDKQVGRLLAYLETIGRKDDTVIALTADHGEVFGDHNCYTHTYHMWEPALRVPFILKFPGQKQMGVYDDRPFTHIDVAPTLLRLVGVEYDAKELTGLAITDTLASPEANRSRFLFSQYNAHGIRRQAVRKDGLKLVHHHEVEKRAEKSLNELESHVEQADPKDLPTLAWDGERYEFFDLSKDPKEMTDLYEKAATNKELLELMAYLKDKTGETGKPVELDPELIEALRNAGYMI